MKTILVWDLPLRVFHWTLAVLVVVSIVSGQLGGNWIDWHSRSGVAIVGLLAFRLVWGVIGSTHARFLSFVAGPRKIVAYLRGEWRGVGHNPLGAWSVLGLLTVLGAQAGTGLFGNDDIAFNGPLYALVDKSTSDLAIGWHKTLFWILLALIAAHLTAIVYYTRIKKQELVRPMLSGRTTTSDSAQTDARGGGWPALIVAVAIGVAASWAAAGGIVPPPPPPAAGGSFDW